MQLPQFKSFASNRDSSKVETAFLLAYLVFILLQFAVAGRAVFNIVFYAFLIPSFMLYLHRECKRAASFFKHAVMVWFYPFFAYASLHGFFFTAEYAEAFKTVHNTIDTALFFAMTALYFHALEPETRARIFMLIGVTAGICAFISLLIYLANNPSDPRLLPLGRANSQLPAAAIYGFGMITGLTALHLNRSTRCTVPLIFAVLACLTVIILTQARLTTFTSIVALLIMGALYCKGKPRRLVIFGLSLLASLELIPALADMTLPEFISALLARGSSYRPELWQLALDEISKNPWIGVGKTVVEHKQSNSPHSVFLATAMLFGYPALFLLLVGITNLGLRLVRRLQLCKPSYLFVILCLMNGIGLSLIDFNRVVAGSSPLWISFWMPLAIAAAEVMRERSKLADA